MTQKTKAITYCIIILLLVFAVGFLNIKAVPQMPHRFWGSVTIGGAPAPDGTLIEAVINSVTFASTTTSNGNYDFQVPADDPDTPTVEGGRTGDLIHFYVAKTYATNHTFTVGDVTQLNLSIAVSTAYADFTSDVTSGTEPLTVKFIDQSKFFDTITAYTWNFGDGNITTTTNANITHTYIQNGTYTVSLTVNGTKNSVNVTSTQTKTNYITVYDSKPTADFYATPTSGIMPLTVNFHDNSTSYDGITSWFWDFGDGTSSTQQNPTHNYTTAGTYTVSLTVTEQDGDANTKTKQNYITVQSTTPTPPTIEILNPTTANPAYTKPGQTFELTLKYSELNPLNMTIKVYNATYTVLQEANQTVIASGTDITVTASITIPESAPDGKYRLSITMFNIYNLSATATQTDAIIVDGTLPKVAITYPTEGSYMSASKIWINGTVTETNVGSLQPMISDTRFTLQAWDSAMGKFAFLNNTAIPDGSITVTINFTDLAQNTGSATVTFTSDTTLPSISYPYQDPPGQIVEPGVTVEVDVGLNITVRVNITDVTSGIKTVTLFYNVSATEWANITMQKTTGSENEYVVTIPSSNLPVCTTIIYYIMATDNANNTAQTPTIGNYFQSHVIPEFTMLTTIMMLTVAAAMVTVTKRKGKRFIH